MSQNRIVYQEWIVNLGYDPARSRPEAAEVEPSYDEEVILAVTRALETLSEEEAALVRSFHFQGLSYQDISRATGREVYRLELLHRRALRSLAARLRPLVATEDVRRERRNTGCPLCCHPAREQIDRLLNSKRREETWKRINAILKERYAVPSLSPRLIIGHLKYHRSPEQKAGNPGPSFGESIA